YKYDLQSSTNTIDYEPIDLKLQLNPNPVQLNSQITFDLPQSESVVIEVYDVMGRRLNTIFSGKLDEGKQQIPLNINLSNGQYWLVLKTDKIQKTIGFVKA
ncbi:MAG: T9SS type A sorting domain-containing protein, partial [Bacteroidota bacterium]